MRKKKNSIKRRHFHLNAGKTLLLASRKSSAFWKVRTRVLRSLHFENRYSSRTGGDDVSWGIISCNLHDEMLTDRRFKRACKSRAFRMQTQFRFSVPSHGINKSYVRCVESIALVRVADYIIIKYLKRCLAMNRELSSMPISHASKIESLWSNSWEKDLSRRLIIYTFRFYSISSNKNGIISMSIISDVMQLTIF